MKTITITLTLLVLLATCACSDSVPSLINYQGKVYQPSGAAVPDGPYKMRFAIYDVPTGGDALWTETYDALQVKGSAFHVLLGSVNPIGASIFNSADRYLGVQLANDAELSPRQKIASVPYAMVAETVPDGSITAAKLAAGAAIPPGLISMWSGPADQIPVGWKLCDGTNGTPDLQDRFVVGAGSEYAVGATGGEKAHKLTVAEMPSHRHNLATNYDASGQNVMLLYPADKAFGQWYTAPEGGDQPHENRPPYYALCFIMKVGE